MLVKVVAPLPLTILPTPGQGLLSNSLVGNNSEADVQGGGSLLTVTLRDDAHLTFLVDLMAGRACVELLGHLRRFCAGGAPVARL